MLFPIRQSAAALAAALFLSTPAAASLLSDYNLVLSGDLTASSLHVYDRAFIGGNLDAQGWLEFGTRLDKNTSQNSVEIAGDARGAATVQAGFLSYGGEYALSGLNCNGNNLSNGRCVLQDSQLADKGAAMADEMQAQSAALAALESNGTVSLEQNRQSFRYADSESVAVFDIDGEDLFGQNSNWSLVVEQATTVIINVAGVNLSNNGGVNLNQGFSVQRNGQNVGASNILWNFYEATSVNLGSMRLNGSLLAPNADITTWNNIDGSLAARSFSGSGEIHNYLFSGDIPPGAPPRAIPLPSSLLLVLAGAAIPVLRRRRASR